MGFISFALFLIMGTVATLLVMGNPVHPSNEEYDSEEYSETQEEPLQTFPPPTAPTIVAVTPQEPETHANFQTCYMKLLGHLTSVCRNKHQRSVAAHLKRTEHVPQQQHQQMASPSEGHTTTFWPRRENVVDACCRKPCHYNKLLTFCPKTTISTRTTTIPTTQAPQAQSRLLPFFVGLLALGLPKKNKEQQKQQGAQGQDHHQRRIHTLNPPNPMEIDVLLVPNGQNVSPQIPASPPPCIRTQPEFGKARNNCGNREPTSEIQQGTIRDPPIDFAYGTSLGTLDGGRW